MLKIRVCSVTQLCLTLCDPMDCSPSGSSVQGIPRQEYCRGLPFPPPGDRPCPEIETASPPASLAVSYISKYKRMCACSVMSDSFQPYGL